MIAQAVFSLLLCIVLVYAWVEYRRSPAVALLSFMVGLAGLYFVWVPSHSTQVAEFVGIGRGVDLILYLWVCISLIVLLNLHLKLRTQHELITALARAIALANVRTHAATNRRHAAGRVSEPAVNAQPALVPMPDPVDGRKPKQTSDQIASSRRSARQAGSRRNSSVPLR
jgi:hypothetical protein